MAALAETSYPDSPLGLARHVYAHARALRAEPRTLAMKIEGRTSAGRGFEIEEGSRWTGRLY